MKLQVVTGDSKKEVIIFRDRQTNRQNLPIIYRYTERCDSLCFSSQPAHLVADFLVCGFALFLVLVFAFNLSFKPDYISLVLVMLERVLFFRLHI